MIRLWWYTGSKEQKVVLAIYIALVLVNSLATGAGLAIGVIAALIGSTVIVAVWSAVDWLSEFLKRTRDAK